MTSNTRNPSSLNKTSAGAIASLIVKGLHLVAAFERPHSARGDLTPTELVLRWADQNQKMLS
jgi:hypothetical protein